MKKLLFDGNGVYIGFVNVVSADIKPVVNWASIVRQMEADSLSKDLSNAIAIHRGLCESWFVVKCSERKYVEEAILDKEVAIDLLIAKIVEYNKYQDNRKER